MNIEHMPQLEPDAEEDFHSERDAALQALDESMEKLSYFLILPEIVKDPIKLRHYLPGAAYENCLDLVKDYIFEQKCNYSLEPQDNPKLMGIIRLFLGLYKLTDISPKWLDNLGSRDKFLLQVHNLAIQLSKRRLKLSAIKELHKEVTMYNICRKKEKSDQSIKDLRIELVNRQEDFLRQLEAKEDEMQDFKRIFKDRKRRKMLIISETLAEPTHRIRRLHQEAMAARKDLQQSVEMEKASYDRLARERLSDESNVYSMRSRAQLQLQLFIQKYDQNILDLVKDSWNIKERLEEKKRTLDEVTAEYEEELKKFERDILPILEEERRRHESKVRFFTETRAARIIQKQWRKYMRMKKRKEKAEKLAQSKGKGKKKK